MCLLRNRGEFSETSLSCHGERLLKRSIAFRETDFALISRWILQVKKRRKRRRRRRKKRERKRRMSHSLENCEQEGMASEKAFKKKRKKTISRWVKRKSDRVSLKWKPVKTLSHRRMKEATRNFFLRYIISQFMKQVKGPVIRSGKLNYLRGWTSRGTVNIFSKRRKINCLDSRLNLKILLLQNERKMREKFEYSISRRGCGKIFTILKFDLFINIS